MFDGTDSDPDEIERRNQEEAAKLAVLAEAQAELVQALARRKVATEWQITPAQGSITVTPSMATAFSDSDLLVKEVEVEPIVLYSRFNGGVRVEGKACKTMTLREYFERVICLYAGCLNIRVDNTKRGVVAAIELITTSLLSLGTTMMSVMDYYVFEKATDGAIIGYRVNMSGVHHLCGLASL